jgi:hypothetical protein
MPEIIYVNTSASAAKPGHTPSLLELMGASEGYDGVRAFAEYANGAGRAAYFIFKDDGTSYQARPAINPLPGMY